MLDAIAERLRDDAGIVKLVDFGVVHVGPVGHASVETSASLETWSGLFYFRVLADLTKGPGFRQARVIKWPYSRKHVDDLDGVLADLKTIAAANAGSPMLADRRTAFGRGFDRLVCRRFLGSYDVKSIIEVTPKCRVEATIEAPGGQRIVGLIESTPPRGFTNAHLPQEAFAALADAVRKRLAAR